MEHNAVMRPLTALGIRYDILRSAPDGTVDLNAAEEMVQPDTKMIIICHESNVNGTIQPIREIGEIAHRKGLMMLADCAQSAGNIPIDIENAWPLLKGRLSWLVTGRDEKENAVDNRRNRFFRECGTETVSRAVQGNPDFFSGREKAG